jgi:transglutaminase-like putative cysteine protease
MAGMSPTMDRQAARRPPAPAILRAPRLFMSWEDWLTLVAALIAFLSVAISVDQANWVRDMPAVVPTALVALVVGMVAARIRLPGLLIHPPVLILGAVVVVLMVQQYADGASIVDRVADVRIRMRDWWDVVISGDISNDNLPFVTLVHSITFLAMYLAAYAIYRWHNPWLAILPGGIVLLTNLGLQRDQQTFPVVFFLFGSILLIARLHLQKNQERWKRQGIEYPEFISLSAAQLTVVIAMGLLFAAWFIPAGGQSTAFERAWEQVTRPFEGTTDTFTRLFHNVDSRRGTRLHTFGPFLAIQGDVKLGTKKLYEVKSGSGGLIRGTSYDEYTGNGWRVSSRDRERIAGGELAASPEVAAYEKRDVSILQVTVTDGDSAILTSGIPLGTNLPSIAETPRGYRGDIEQLATRRGLREGDIYNSLGSRSTATAAELNAAGTGYPDWVRERYLQLPGGLPDRVAAEARRVVEAAGATTPYQQAVAIEAYLREFPYNLAVPAAPPGRDVVDFLLNDLKQGYFDYQATAMAVMLRTLGVPARIAVGYLLDQDTVVETTYTVRKADAYSWVEVWFPRYGWVNFNPTADQPAGGADGGFGVGDFTIDPALETDVPLDELFGDILLDPGNPLLNPFDALGEQPVLNEPFPWWLVWTLTGLAVVAVGVAGAGRVAWTWGLAGLEGPVRLWARVQRLAGWTRAGAVDGETPREFARRLGHRIQRPDETSRLADAYEEARYGRPDLQRVDPATTEDSYREVRNGLLRTFFAQRFSSPARPRRRTR